jgi:hypothetical protein
MCVRATGQKSFARSFHDLHLKDCARQAVIGP